MDPETYALLIAFNTCFSKCLGDFLATKKCSKVSMITMGGTVGKAFKKGQRQCKKDTGWDLEKLTARGGWALINELFHLCALIFLTKAGNQAGQAGYGEPVVLLWAIGACVYEGDLLMQKKTSTSPVA